MTSPSPDFQAAPRSGGAAATPSEVLRSAVDLFVQAPAHERTEIRAFADLLDGLLPAADVADRAHAALRLARRADTPPAIARMLAMDAAEIARPLVLGSPVLTSSDLVQIMRRGPEHVALVAERLDLTPDVVLALGRSIGDEARIATRPTSETEAPPAEANQVTAAVEAIVGEAVRAKPIGDADTESELALQRALDELAAELEAEAQAHEDEAAAARSLRAHAPALADGIDAFLDRDPAGRWRYIQEHAAGATLSSPPPRRRRSDDPATIGARLFGALVAGERDRLSDDLATAARLDPVLVERILTDRHGDALAVTLAALGIDDRTATSILLLHAGERVTLGHMQDLSAMAGGIGWRTADRILTLWRGERQSGRGEAMRVLDPAERRGAATRDGAAAETRRDAEEPLRRRGEG
jgi:hypothetical protein